MDPAPERPALLPDILRPGLDIVFVGAAPSLQAAMTGHYYAGSRNRFWRLLHQSGLTPVLLDASEHWRALEYGIGLTAILPGEISTSNDLLSPPGAEQRAALMAKMGDLAPRIVCYNGRDVFRMCHGEDPPRWGRQQERLGASVQFVVHSSSGRADRWGADRLFLYRELRALRDFLTGAPAGD